MQKQTKTDTILMAIAVMLLMLVCAAFVHLWCGIELNILSKGASSLDGTLEEPLPGITLIFYEYFRWGYGLVLFPIIAALVQFKSVTCRTTWILYAISVILAIVWVGSCVIAWRVPYMIFNVQIGA